MPAQKTELKTLTKARLLEAAVLLFSRGGFTGTGTREIARLADINESTLFRHYPTKKDLFWAALETRLTRLKFDRELQSSLAANEEPHIVLPMIFEFLLRTMSEQPELMRLLYISALELPGGEPMYQKHLGPIFDSIETFFGNCCGNGLISEVDSRILTFALIGTVIANITSYEVFVGQALPLAEMQDAVRVFAEFWLNLLVRRNPLAQMLPQNADVSTDISELTTQG